MRKMLMLCDEKSMEKFGALLGPNVEFLELQGMAMEGGKHQFLVTPVVQLPNPPGEAVIDV
jgi:hypothetical protein